MAKLITCNICFDENIKDPVFTPCFHGFCKECISKWINEKKYDIKCPSCRYDISDMANIYRDPSSVTSTYFPIAFSVVRDRNARLPDVQQDNDIEQMLEQANRSNDHSVLPPRTPMLRRTYGMLNVSRPYTTAPIQSSAVYTAVSRPYTTTAPIQSSAVYTAVPNYITTSPPAYFTASNYMP